MMRTFARGNAAINVLARSGDLSVEVIDVGVDADLSSIVELRHAKIRHGSRNMLVEPAMTHEEYAGALAVGSDAVQRAASDGVQAIGLGEMGIGNTTSAAAVLSALTGLPSEQTVGRGTGIDDAGLLRKRDVVDRAVATHRDRIVSGQSRVSAAESLRCVGGLELVAIAGAVLEAARRNIAVVADGFISTVAVLAAARIAAQVPDSYDADNLVRALFFAHRGSELGHDAALAACADIRGIDAQPILALGLRLGEGSGAALAMPLLRSAAAIMREMATFAEAGVSTASLPE
jgi:nicotinate-nucleotide--dimethylbenzimidazole phosphoribosyltransferase